MIGDKTSNIVNLIILIYEQYIYSSKCQGKKPTVQELTTKILWHERLENYNSRNSPTRVQKTHS